MPIKEEECELLIARSRLEILMFTADLPHVKERGAAHAFSAIMSHWVSPPPAGERQYLTQQEREHQWLNHEEEASMWAHYNCHRQNSQMDIRRHGAQETQSPPLYHQDHHRMAQSQNIGDWPNLYVPLRCQAPPNVTLHHSGARTETWAKYEPHLPSYEFLPPLIVERGHEDISLHHNADCDYMVGRIVNHNNLHYLESKWQMFNSTHARGHFNECSRGCSKGGSSGRSRGGSSGRSRGGSSGRSRGGSSGRSRGGSSGCSRGGSSGRSRAHSSRSPRLDFQAKHVTPSQTTTNSSPDIQNANNTPTVPVVNNEHSETTSGRTAGPVRDSISLVQAFTSTTQQCVSMDLPSTGGRESGVVDLKAAQQHTPSPSPKPLTETPQDKPPHKHKTSLNEIQDWLQSVLRSKNGPVNGNNSTQDPSQSQQSSTEKMAVLQAGNTHRHLNTKDDQARPPERFSAEDSTVRLEIKSTPRYITQTAVTTAPPPVAIVPPMGPQQSPEPMETENAGNEVPFKILHAWSINEQQAGRLWERAKDDASSLSVLNETVQVESVMEYDKPVDASATSSLASIGEDNDEVLQVIAQMDKSSPLPFVHTNPQATDIVRIGGTQIIVEVSSNGADERTLDLSTISEVQFKLSTLQQLVSYLESAATVTDAKDGCLKAILELYWGGDTSNLVKALKDKRDEKIMQDVSAWAVEDEKAVVVFAVSGISLGEVVENFPIPAHVDSSSHMGYRSSWLNVNEKLYDIDKESGRAWSLWFIPDKAEESSKVVGEVKMDDTFHSKMETVDLPARQPVEAESTDSDLATNTALMMDAEAPKETDLPTDADSETEPLSPMILTVLTSEDAVRLLAETTAPDADLTTASNCPTDADFNTVTDLTTDSDTDTLSPMKLTILTSEDAMRLFCQIENGSDLQLGSPEPCSENKDKTQTKQLENIVSGSLDKSCYCPCIIETDNGFESGLCSSCQREKGLQQGTRCITIAHCFTLSDTSNNSDQETEEVPKDSGGKATVDNQHTDKKPHALHKRRHSTESDRNRCKDEKRGSSTEKACEGSQSRDDMKPLKRRHSTEKESENNQSRDKKRRPLIEKVGEGSQSRDKMSQKRRNSTETEGRNSGDSKELQCQLVERERDSCSGNAPPCPGVKTLHVQGSSTTTVPLKLFINVPKKPSTNGSPSKHAEEVPNMPMEQPKTKAPNKTSRHRSPAKSVSPVVKEWQRNGVKHKQKIQLLKVRLEKLSLSKHLVRKGSPPSRNREEGSPPRQKMVEDRGDPGGLVVKVSKNPDLSMKLKHKAESDLTSQQKLTKIPKVLNSNEKGWFSKSECENDSPPPKPKLPRIPKLPRTPEVSKDGNEGENKEETSPSASPESQTLNKPARVAHKPKPFIKPASHNGNSPGSHAFPNSERVSPPYGHFGAKVSARQQVFSDWESSFVPTPTPRTRRRSGWPPEEVEGPQASPRSSSETRIIQPILKRVDAPAKPKRNISFALNPRKVHYFKPCEYENDVMFNRSYMDPEDAQCSDEEEEDASVNCQNTKEQPPVREEKRQDIGELKPGPSGACEKSFKRKREIHKPAAILMKKSIVQANHWMKSLHR
ncbi:uncharacterized protein LOC121575711 isoform X2 [Coregonus clupeaformis]|uniref:uncharacterized protein LOC121575711 isoform X2 n=1 Tax=Coregonus clupeaformis TaxID=59861 RepID=UPI001E1C6214|nr:uncharacterized protein LOC121575711 isoform X2 [Coregonus clupeaformis]